MSGRKALGRGLAAIIPVSPVSEQPEPEVLLTSGPQEVAIADIAPNPDQPRRYFDQAQLNELASSLREHGMLEPVIVRPVGQGYELVVGERRWRAAQLAGLQTIPAIIRQLDDRQVMELALVENLQREDLNPIEEAEAFQRLAGDFNLTQEQIAERMGKQRSTVANRIRLLELEPAIQDHVRQGRMSAGHARALLAVIDRKERADLATRCISESLSVRQVEEAAKVAGTPKRAKAVKARKAAAVGILPELEEEFQQALGTRVRIIKQGLGGHIEIEFYGDEDITRIYELIVKP